MCNANKLLIVILNYKVTDLTIDCLRSLAPEVAAMPGCRVAVLENGTGEADYRRLEAEIAANGWQGWVHLEGVTPNRGFCGGNNIVLRKALAQPEPPPFIQLLNADTLVRPGALAALVAFMETHPRAGIAGSRLLSREGEDQTPAFRFPTVPGEFAQELSLGPVARLLERWMVVPPLPDSTRPVGWVPGASMILRTAMLQDIGILDEDLYTYFDDIDICQRAHRAGWEVWFVRESEVVHLEGASTGVHHRQQKRRPGYWFEARRRCYLRNYGPVRTALLDAAFIAGCAGRRLRVAIGGKPDTDPPNFLGDFIRHSVFATGFAVRPVQNPALLRPDQPQRA